VTFPLTGAHATRERSHLVENRVDLGHDVDPVDYERGLFGHAQRDVEHGAVFRDVDVLASEHPISSLAQLRLVR
jgi:hypothetical protein